ncbi:MAG TPA: magnesium transporter CorA family protein [Candidatus Paceibacterota bacterium]
MIQNYKTNGLTWVDLSSPTNEEIRKVADEYQLHPLVAHELSVSTLRAKVDLYDNLIYLILHFPSSHKDGDGISDQEVDFVIGKDFIITARYGEVDALLSFSRSFEVEAILEKGNIGKHAGYIFFAMVNRIYDNLLHRIEGLKEEAALIEAQIFKGKEREMVMKISEVSREILDFKRATSLHDEIFESFEVAGAKFFGDDFRFHLRALTGNYYKLENSIKNTLEYISELRETNNSLLSSKQNEIMKTLTIMAFVTFPLALVVSIFGLDTNYVPIIGQPYDFWIIIGILSGLTALFFVFFKYKKWL